MQHPLPRLVTFDGHARSGKGTVVSRVKDYLRDQCGHQVMLIDAGQVFRVLVIALERAGVDLDDPSQIDSYLSDPANVEAAVKLVKAVYRMDKSERDELIYTLEVGADSAKVGARPLSQSFKDQMLDKWLVDARAEGCDTVLLDGRALEETGSRLENAGLTEYVLGLFFICDPVVSAQRMLKLPVGPYPELSSTDRARVDAIVAQIAERNRADTERAVQPVVAPLGAPTYPMDQIPTSLPARSPRPMAIIDRSLEMPMETMALPIAQLVENYLKQ